MNEVTTRWKEEFGRREPFPIRKLVDCTGFAEGDSRSRSRFLAAAALMAALCALSACAPPSLRELVQGAGEAVEAATTVMQPSQNAVEDPLLDFLAEAEDGEVRDLENAVSGNRLRVTAGRVYHAASGRICRRFTALGAATGEADEEGLACKGATGRWMRVGILAPVSP